MRLKKIKLSGFKSFVDVATVPVDKNLVGIVGPNGCGKSNVIDAVRWVMGESTAKNLRGDSLTDVIFNGSSGRKPVGQASIELVFDNTHNPLVGQYASYSEIAIKRLINRDGQSNYYINNTRCRRKDLADVFLGTGLGPRSYSIIEQGMISRIIEAKPEDLRLYLEEAAGISKYKERRRETELRIKHTQENLDRVNDIRNELAKQLEKLAKQSEIAEQYKVLKAEFVIQEKYDLGLQFKKLQEDHRLITIDVNQFNIDLEEINSKTQSFNTELEHKKIAVSQLHHEQQQEQAQFFKLQQQINNTEQEIKHQESEQAHCNLNLTNVEKQLQFCISNLTIKKQDLDQTNIKIAELQPEYDSLKNNKTEVLEQLKAIEQEYNQWEHQWDEKLQLEYNNNKIINQSQAVIEKHDTLIVRMQNRITVLKQEQKELQQQSQYDNQEIKNLKVKLQDFNVSHEQKQQELAASLEKYKLLEAEITELQNQLNLLNKQQQISTGRLSSLETLQEQALGKDQKNLNQWLTDNNLKTAKRLGEVIVIESGWELALETIIRDYIKAIIITKDSNFDGKNLKASDLALISKFNTAFINVAQLSDADSKINSETVQVANTSNNNLFINKITAPIEIAHLLNNIYYADDLNAAKAMLPNLAYHQSVITKDGLWLNNSWFTAGLANVQHENGEQHSILTRENLIKNLKTDVQSLIKEIEVLNSNIIDKKQEAKLFNSNRDELQKALMISVNSQSEIKSQISRQESKADQQRNRLYKIEQELSEAVKHIETDTVAVKQQRSKLEQSMAVMEGFTEEKVRLQSLGEQLKINLKNTRVKSDELKDSLHKSELNIQKLQQQQRHLSEEINKLQHQQTRLNSEQQTLKTNSLKFADPIANLKRQLAVFLDDKQVQSDKLAIKNQEYDLANQELNNIEKKITEIRKDYETLRDKIQAAKIKQQEFATKLNSVTEILQEKNIIVEDLLELFKTLDADIISVSTVKTKLKQLKLDLDNLGPVNLTAIDEYQVEFQRKAFLDTQDADLQEALTALLQAIEQIDNETKLRFKETFDYVNEQFQYLFPKVFCGGKASLTLSSTDILDSGVTVMAQPPGKRNASIHLLSGGEKALTAIALVFAIFRLNPAPFCMLDEVDAPLDDANVERYCNLVKEMAKDVQFIFITHNKVAMLMAEHLIGVTMHEPGVSRLVSVDIEEAVELAQA